MVGDENAGMVLRLADIILLLSINCKTNTCSNITKFLKVLTYDKAHIYRP